MLIRNKTNAGKSYFVADKRIVFQALQEKELGSTIANFLLSEYSHELENVVNVQTEQLIIDEPQIKESQSLLNEAPTAPKRRGRKKRS